MCGIVGFCDYTETSDKITLREMLKTISHRGPDDEGILFYKTRSANIGLGHKRLSIIDLTQHAHQPMLFDNLCIVFNGEIYNFRKIQNELEEYGYKFDSNSDTEVILKAFHKWGVNFLNKLNGMFAIAILDCKNNKLYLFRDRIGIKPLYYYYKDGLFMFASEIKAFFKHINFKKELNKHAIWEYFHRGYISYNDTIFQNTYKLPKATYLILDINDNNFKIKTYWKVDITNEINDENYALHKLNQLINESVNLRLVADVEIGSFLSGGIDSSLITAIAQKNSSKKIKTFTIGFQHKDFDESIYAKQIAKYLDTEHYEYFITKNDFKEVLNKIPFILDEPMADSSIIPTTILSLITKKYVKVSLSADGGDELFGGYISYAKALNLYKNKYLFTFIKPLFLLNLKNRKYNRIKSLIKVKDLIDIHVFFSSIFTQYDLKKLFTFKVDFDKSLKNSYPFIDSLLYKDFNYTLVDQLLTKIDRASMFASLEVRVPLLDYNIVEFVYKLDRRFRMNKNLLKKLAYSYIPSALLDRPKKGFRIPLKNLLEYYDYKRFFDKNFILKQNLFNFSYVKYLENSFKNKNYNVNQIWSYLVFQLWYEYWNIGEDNE
jgi:asparagine synthase (glutamine-hydrolysing)